jgi:DNA-binding GntR family transcriptional regulator
VQTEKNNHPSRSLERKTLTDGVYDSLRQDIISTRLKPNSPLQEVAIANDLGVSRGPVREALQKLSSDGLVNIIPHKGAFVSSLTWEEFIDAYQVREALEVLGVRLASKKMSADDLQVLENLHEQMNQHAEAEEVDNFFEVNERLHTEIINHSGNHKLIERYYPLKDQMRRYRMRSLTLRGGLKRSCSEHRLILDALHLGDSQAAAKLMGEHIQIPKQLLLSEHADKELELVALKS